MIHSDLEDLVKVIARPEGHITIETAGIHFFPNLHCDLMSISPKLSNSTPQDPVQAAEHESKRFNLNTLKKLIQEYEYQLKFVVDKPEDLDEIAGCLEDLGLVDPYKVYLMPQATTRTEYLEKSQWLAEICLKTGFLFSPRLQVILWDNQPGH